MEFSFLSDEEWAVKLSAGLVVAENVFVFLRSLWDKVDGSAGNNFFYDITSNTRNFQLVFGEEMRLWKVWFLFSHCTMSEL